MSVFNSQPMSVNQKKISPKSQDYMLLPQDLRPVAGQARLDSQETTSAKPQQSGKNYGPNGCYNDPLSWTCYRQDNKCICPMRGDLPSKQQ